MVFVHIYFMTQNENHRICKVNLFFGGIMGNAETTDVKQKLKMNRNEEKIKPFQLKTRLRQTELGINRKMESWDLGES